jgi:hypothetical protein
MFNVKTLTKVSFWSTKLNARGIKGEISWATFVAVFGNPQS